MSILWGVDNMFGAHKIKKLFKNDDPKLVYILRNKSIPLNEVFKDDTDLLERSIRHHKNAIAEAELMSNCDNINKTNAKNQSYAMIAIEANNEKMFNQLLDRDIKLDIADSNRETALFYAIKNEERGYFDALIEKKVDLKGFNHKGENSAMFAYKHGRKKLALQLLENKVFINHIDKDGNTILHYAVRNNDVEFALKLLELGSDLFVKNYLNQSALEIAKELKMEDRMIDKISELISNLFAEQDNQRIDELLVDNFDVEDYKHFNIPFLIAYNAVKYHNDEVFGKIIRNIDLLNSVDYLGNSLLMYCIEFNQFLMAKKIIYLEVDVDLKNLDGQSALLILLDKITHDKNEKMVYQYKELFNDLIEYHADVNIQDNLGNTVLMYAIEAKEEELIDALIDYSEVDLNLCNEAGKTALILAYELKDYTSVHKIIISRKADINHMDRNHNTLLLLAMLDDDLELFTALLHNGADLNLKYQDGMTILMIALMHNKMRFVAKIFEHPFSVDLKDEFGNTALMHAIKVNNYQTVKALLKLGANKRLCDKQGNNPIYVALDLNAMDIAKLLKSNEVN
jgi:ankyrin repeat protein